MVLNGVASDWMDVLSGVPQGSVLGPILFAIFINDIDAFMLSLDTFLNKFADDTKIGQPVGSPEGVVRLQKALDNIVTWSEDWQMQFHIDKCKVLHCGHNNPRSDYLMHGNSLEHISEQKDLGVIIHNSLKPSLQCAAAAKKANQVRGQIVRSFSFRSRDIITRLYKCYVRPHLEYAVQAWSPWTAKDIDLLESVQKRAVRMISGLSGSYEEKLHQIGLLSLSQRRQRGDLIETYKILKGFSDVQPSTWFKPAERENGSQTRQSSSPFSLLVPKSKLDVRKNSFSHRVIGPWNNLPDSVRQADSVNMFKNKLDAYMFHHTVLVTA